MKAALLLKIAAGLALVHGVMHTIGGVFGGAASGAQLEAWTVMKVNRFVAMGVTRSYWDYYMGYGLFVTVSFLVQTVVFWQLATLAKTEARRIRPIVMAFGVGYLAWAAVAWRYFFMAPAVFEILIAGCLLGAWALAGREDRAKLR